MTSGNDGDDGGTWDVVVNDEEQYSIWPAGRDGAPGWRAAGYTGTKAACLAFIQEHWTDMRPLSLRRKSPPSAV